MYTIALLIRKVGITLYKEKINLKLILFVWLAVGFIALFNIKEVEGATDRNIEVTRSITLSQVEDTAGLENEINQIDGVIILQSSGGSHSSNYTLLIPRDNFDESLEKILQYGKVKSDSRSQHDITDRVSALENSISSNKEHKNVIMTFIEQAKTVDTILEFEQYLMEVEVEQTNNQNQLYGLEDLSNYTTLDLSISPLSVGEPTFEDSFTSRLGTAFKDSFTNTKVFFEYVLVAISYVLIPLVFISVIVLVVVKLGKRGKSHEKK